VRKETVYKGYEAETNAVNTTFQNKSIARVFTDYLFLPIFTV